MKPKVKVTTTTTSVEVLEVSVVQIRDLVLEALKSRLPADEVLAREKGMRVDFEFQVTANQYGDEAELLGAKVTITRTTKGE